jgi:hypothetical protein
MPHAFQVLTSSLQAMCSHIISGLCHWYVDDLMTVSHVDNQQRDSAIVDVHVQQLIAANKSFNARQLEFLGWIFHLDKQTSPAIFNICYMGRNQAPHSGSVSNDGVDGG